MIPRILPFILFLFPFTQISAQCNKPYPSDNACTAPYFCNTAQLNAHCSAIRVPIFGKTYLNPKGFCGSLESPSWYKIKANSATLSLRFSAGANCGADGVQAVIFSTTNCADSASFSPVSNCINSNGGQPVADVTATSLIAGQTYYLLVDGYSGAGCSFNITVLSGTIQDVVDPLPTPTDIFGASVVCNGVTNSVYSVPFNPNAAEYIFSIAANGGAPQIVSRSDSFYNFTNFPASGTVKVCVNYKNDCTQSQQKCLDVVIGASNVVTLPTVYLCPGSSATLGDGTVVQNTPTPVADVTAPYTFSKTGSAGCDTTFNVNVVKYANRKTSKFFFIKKDKSETLGNTILTPNADCSPKSGATTLKNTALNGCDSIVNYTIYNATQTYTLNATKFALDCKDSIALGLVNNNDACNAISHNLTYKWVYQTTAGGAIVNQNNNTIAQLAKIAGVYSVVVFDSVYVKLQPLLGNRIFTDTLSITITQNAVANTLATPTTIDKNSQYYECQGSTNNFSINAVAGAKSYTWRTPNGTIKSGQGTTSVSVSWPINFATDTLQVIALSDCGNSLPLSLVIYFYNFANLNAGNDTVFCDLSAKLNATTSTIQVGGTGTWSNAASNPQNVNFVNYSIPNTQINIPSIGIYNLIWTENYSGCTKSDTVQITVLKKPVVGNISDSCSADKKSAFVSFNISDGSLPFVLLNTSNNTAQTINKLGVFTTPSFPKGTYSYSLRDASNCSTFLITGTSASCNAVACTKLAGSMSATLLNLCYSDTARANFLGGTKKTAKDTSEFVLHNGDAHFGILARNNTAKFAFFAGLTYGKKYFISEIVGSDSTGHVKLLDSCFSAGSSQPVIFNPKPTTLFSSNDTFLCRGNCAKVKVSNSGFAPFTVRARLTDTVTHDSSFVNLKTTDAFSFCPRNSTAFKLISVSDSLGCVDSSLTKQFNFTVFLPPFAGAPLPSQKYCASLDTTIQLSKLLVNADLGGNWYEVSAVKSSGNAFNPLAGTFRTINQAVGVYRFSYIKTAQPATSPCSSDTAFVNVEIITAPTANAGADDTITCNHRIAQLGGNNTTQGNGVTISWSGSGLNGNVLRQFVSQAGTYILKVQTGACFATDTVVVYIDTITPTAKIKPIVGIISCTNPKINLDASLSTPKAGVSYQWSFNAAPINQSINFDATSGGSYALKVTLNKNGCSTIDTVFINQDIKKPTVSIVPPGPITCKDSTVVIDATASSTGKNYTLKWIARLNGHFIADSTTLMPKVNSAGDYKLVISDNTNKCSDSLTVTVATDTTAPVATAYATDSLNCRNKTVSLSAKGTSFGKSISYQWFAKPGNIVSGENTLNAVVDQPGTYIFIVNNTNNGCNNSNSVKVNRIKAFPTSQRVLTAKPSCYGECDGSIHIDSIVGGTLPFKFSLDGFNYFSSQNFNNLCAGNYHIYTQDANGCQIDTALLLMQDKQLTATFGQDSITINLGDSLTLKLYTNSDSLLKTDWSFYSDSACMKAPICLQEQVKPTTVTTYKVHVTDRNLCAADAQIRVAINKTLPVFIPNAFSPNGDGQNDLFYIFSAPVVRKVRNFRVFNRWGELVFQQTDFQTNNPTNGWDGFYHGKEAALGVYTYSAEIEFLDNSVGIFNGEVTLLR